MKTLAAAVLAFAGTLLLGLGGLFALGSAGQTRRLIVAAAALVAGGLLVAKSAAMARRLRRYSPQGLRAEILRLAHRHQGEFSLAELEAQLGDRLGRGHRVLDRLEEQGICRRRLHHGSSYFVFASMQARLAVKYCPFCEAELPLESLLASCPKCGGVLETEIKLLALGGSDLYGMDDESQN